MGKLHRAINLIIALVLTVMGCGGFVYFYFINTTWPRWNVMAAIVVGAAGLYWLWDEHLNAVSRSKN